MESEESAGVRIYRFSSSRFPFPLDAKDLFTLQRNAITVSFEQQLHYVISVYVISENQITERNKGISSDERCNVSFKIYKVSKVITQGRRVGVFFLNSCIFEASKVRKSKT